MTDYSGEIGTLARLLVAKHGVRAPAVARHEALRARHAGAAERAEAWLDIALSAEASFRQESAD